MKTNVAAMLCVALIAASSANAQSERPAERGASAPKQPQRTQSIDAALSRSPDGADAHGAVTPGAAQSPSGSDAPWSTKAAFLEATRNGEFAGLPNIRVNQEEAMAPLTESVIHILRTEYQVPPLQKGREMGLGTCRGQVASEIRRLFTDLTAYELASLTDRPPTFQRATESRGYPASIATEVAGLGRGGGYCTTTVMGVEKRHPYGVALRSLADDFLDATATYVDAERGRRVTAYREAQARIAAEQRAKAEAQAKRVAAEQQRIDAEHARIQADQQKRQQQEQSRIGG